jgi:hypothetical protein
VPFFVILRETKDLSPAQPGHGSTRCFAPLSMTILLRVSPSWFSCHPQTFMDPIRIYLFRMMTAVRHRTRYFV